jgi:hypothetical protein
MTERAKFTLGFIAIHFLLGLLLQFVGHTPLFHYCWGLIMGAFLCFCFMPDRNT